MADTFDLSAYKDPVPTAPPADTSSPPGGFDMSKYAPTTLQKVNDSVATIIDAAGQRIAVPGHPDWNVTNLANKLTTMFDSPTMSDLVTGDTPYTRAQKEVEAAKARNPGSATAGKIIGEGVDAYAGGELGAGVAGGLLPQATRLAQVGRGVITGATAGAAADPEHPLEGAGSGAAVGGVLSTAGAALGAGVSALSKNTPAEMREIADSSDALVGKWSNAGGAGTAEVMGRPNLTGERSVANALNNNPIIRWIPGFKTVDKVLVGASERQGAKAVGADVAGAQAAIDTNEAVGGNWPEKLAADPALQSAQAKIDMHNPAKFAEYYPKLTPDGKNAAVAGMLENAMKDSAKVAGDNNTVVDLPTLNQHLKDIISTTGNLSFNGGIKGQQKWTLQGLQKIVDMAVNPDASKATLAKAAANLKPSSGGLRAIAQVGVTAMDDLIAPILHGGAVLSGAKYAGLYGLMNTALNSKPVRNALINLASAQTPTTTVKALVGLRAAMAPDQDNDSFDLGRYK